MATKWSKQASREADARKIGFLEVPFSFYQTVTLYRSLPAFRYLNNSASTVDGHFHLHREGSIWHGGSYKSLGFRVELQPARQLLAANSSYNYNDVVAGA